VSTEIADNMEQQTNVTVFQCCRPI